MDKQFLINTLVTKSQQIVGEYIAKYKANPNPKLIEELKQKLSVEQVNTIHEFLSNELNAKEVTEDILMIGYASMLKFIQDAMIK